MKKRPEVDIEDLARQLAKIPLTYKCRDCDGSGDCSWCDPMKYGDSMACYCFADPNKPSGFYIEWQENHDDELHPDLCPLWDCPSGECQCTQCLNIGYSDANECANCEGRGWHYTEPAREMRLVISELAIARIERRRRNRLQEKALARQHEAISEAVVEHKGPVVYVIEHDTHVKIGYSGKGFKGAKSRLESLQTGNEKRLKLVGLVSDDEQGTRERQLHSLFGEYRAEGGSEWFEKRGPVRSWVNNFKHHQKAV